MAYDHISGHGKDGVLQRIHCEFTEDEIRMLKEAVKDYYLNYKFSDEASYKTISNLIKYFEIDVVVKREKKR